MRTAACEAWGKRNTPEAAAPLAGVLNGNVNQDVRLAAARALGQTHEQAAINALANALEDKSVAMQRRAVLSLQQITAQDLGNNVNKWREYAKANKLTPYRPPISLAERLGLSR